MPSSLRTRLTLGLAAIAAAVALLSAAAVLSLDRLGGAVSTILRENYASVIACEQMKEALERQDSAALFAALGHDDIARPMLEMHRRGFQQAFDREAANVTLPGEEERVREIERLYGEYADAVDRLVALPPAERSPAYFHELLPRFNVLKDRIQGVLRINQENMERANGDAKRLAERTVQGGLAIGLVAAFLAVAMAWWLPRAIIRPVEGFIRTAKAIGEGNFSVAVEAPVVAELAQLADAFNRMLERLREYRESSLGELLAAKDVGRATLECMLDPVVVFDGGDAVLYANEAAEVAFGLRAGSAEELRAARMVVPGALASARNSVLATGAPVLPRSLSEAMPWCGPEGERHYLVRAVPLRTTIGDGPRAILLAQDVTRFRRIDALKTDMVATVSHEFKTPLTSLRMATHLLLEPSSGPLTDDQRELVTTARDDAERLRAMVEDLLDVVRIESDAGALHRSPVDPSGLLFEVADAHRAVAREKGVTLEVDPGTGQGLVPLDPERISIALANLVANAIRHTPAGGKITLSARRSEGALTLDVADSGEGLDLGDRLRILARAAPGAAPNSRARHGLGLTIVQEVVLQHGGELRVTSEPGKGSVFTLALPI
jgi:two-component system, NtrC family, sensor histidine kinase KinB